MKFLKDIYNKIFGIDDLPQKIALGMALGVFFGVMPAMGPIIAAFFAVLFRVNRAAAVAGSLLTNTWLTIPAFVAAVAIGDVVTGISYNDIANAWQALVKNFTLQTLGTFSVYRIAFPIITGYIIVSSILAIIAYFITITILHYSNKRR